VAISFEQSLIDVWLTPKSSNWALSIIPFGKLPRAVCDRWTLSSKGTRFEGLNRTHKQIRGGQKWRGAQHALAARLRRRR